MYVSRFQGGTLQKESFLEGCTRRILSEKDVEAQSTTLTFDDRCIHEKWNGAAPLGQQHRLQSAKPLFSILDFKMQWNCKKVDATSKESEH